jgi:Terminase RNaseH-like domain
VTAGWDDSPHLSDDIKSSLLASIPPHEREARRNGTPSLGSGAIYPVDPDSFVVADFVIPDHWARCYGLDVGWNATAAVWAAWDRESDVVHLYSEHKAGAAIPAIHAESIKARGEYIPGVIDPASAGSSQHDGARLIDLYRQCGLDVEFADNSVEAGIYATWQRLVAGKLKVFASLTNWLAEFKRYRRDEHGKVVKQFDHALDASRYALMSGLSRAQTKPVEKPLDPALEISADELGGWML